MKNAALVLVGLIVLLSVSSCSDPVMPPGYKLLCSPDGAYSIWVPDSDLSTGGYNSGNVWYNARDAKKFAIEWEKVRYTFKPEIDKKTFDECR